MIKDIKFTVHLNRREYEKERHQYLHQIIGYRPSKEVGVDDEPEYGKEIIATKKGTITKPEEKLAKYEQIPLIVGNIPISVIQTSYNDCQKEGIEICKKVAAEGEFCSIDKLNQYVTKANFHHSASPYNITYGYEYTDEFGTVSFEYETQEDRNKSAFRNTGYEFEKLDWIDRVTSKKENSDLPKQAVKK